MLKRYLLNWALALFYMTLMFVNIEQLFWAQTVVVQFLSGSACALAVLLVIPVLEEMKGQRSYMAGIRGSYHYRVGDFQTKWKLLWKF